MGIAPISSGVNPAYGVTASATTSAAVAPKKTENTPAPVGDKVSLGSSEEAAPKKKGFLQWLKDLVKTEVDGPGVPYLVRVGHDLDAIMNNAQPGEIPDSMPQHTKSVGEPTEYYIPGEGSHSGLSVSVPVDKAPTMADVADFKTISTREATADYQERGLADRMNRTEKALIKEYCGRSFMAMNEFLLGGPDTDNHAINRAVCCAAGGLEKCDVTPGIILNRCASLSELLNYVGEEDYAKYKNFDGKGKTEKLAQILNQRLTGTQSTRKTFISTSVGKEADFLSRPKVVTKFYVGEGVKGAYVSADPNLITYSGEKEYLIAPNMTTTVMGVEYNPENKGLVMHVFLGEQSNA